jgi:hypothetical protein
MPRHSRAVSRQGGSGIERVASRVRDATRGSSPVRRCFPSSLALALLIALTAACLPEAATAQREPAGWRVHPELVDSTWGPRMQAAWRLAWDRRWREADEAFVGLQREQPDAMEPWVGRAFVARGQLRLASARGFYEEALAREPTAVEVRRQALAIEWARVGSVEALVGRAAGLGDETGLGSVDLVVPVRSDLTVLARGGSMVGSSPLQPSPGGRVDSVAAVLLSVGLVVHPTDDLWITPRFERWSVPGEDAVYGWLDAAYRVGRRVSVLASVRALSAKGAPVFGAGAEVAMSDAGDVLTLYALQALRPAEREARHQLRVFLTSALSRRMLYRAGAVVERGGAVSAGTIVLGTTYLLAAPVGLRLELSQRNGFAPQQSILGGLVLRW